MRKRRKIARTCKIRQEVSSLAMRSGRMRDKGPLSLSGKRQVKRSDAMRKTSGLIRLRSEQAHTKMTKRATAPPGGQVLCAVKLLKWKMAYLVRHRVAVKQK